MDTDTYDNVPSNKDLSHVVDLDVVKARSSVHSEPSHSRDDFKSKLLARDLGCPWTGMDGPYVQACHIIPFRRGLTVCLSNLRSQKISDRLPSFGYSVVSANCRESFMLRRGCDDSIRY